MLFDAGIHVSKLKDERRIHLLFEPTTAELALFRVRTSQTKSATDSSEKCVVQLRSCKRDAMRRGSGWRFLAAEPLGENEAASTSTAAFSPRRLCHRRLIAVLALFFISLSLVCVVLAMVCRRSLLLSRTW